MSSRFECIKDVKDTHFHKQLKDLYDRCVIIEEMEQKSPTDCVSMIRKQNERLVKYLYCRLNRIETTRLTTFEILQDKTFTRKIVNPTLIKSMDRLRFDGNEATHEDSLDVDGPMAAAIGITTFSFVMMRVCEIVDRLPPMEEKPPIEEKPSLKGTVNITLNETVTQRGTVHRSLIAEVKNSNASENALRYRWVEIVKDGKEIELQRGRFNHFDLPAELAGKTYQCIVTSAETMGRRASKKYNIDTLLAKDNAKKDEPNLEKKKESTMTSKEVEDKSDIIRVAAQSIPKRNQSNSKNYKQEDEVKRQIALATSVTHCGVVAHPMKLPKHRINLFDSTYGLVHYFVRPNDEFALNSLEILSADAYLYRILKQEGYDRVAFVDEGSTDCQIYAYDLNSEDIFKANLSGEEKGLQRINSTKAAQPETWMQDQSPFGKREIRRLSRNETSKKEFAARISSALGDKRYKTAIVMPILILEKSGYYGDEVVDIINRIEREGNQGNVLIFTMAQRDDILYCFNEWGSRIHSWASPIMTKVRRGVVDQAREAIENLRKRGLIVLADEYETDEITNLLFRKKLIEKKGLLINLPMQKIYPLAAKLKEHCLQIRKHFIQIEYQNRQDSCIRQLNTLLDRKEIQEELIQAAAKVKDATIGVTKGLHPVLLERVYHISLDRFEDDSSIEEIISEFDKLVGVEIQTVKEEIITAADKFTWEHQKNQEKMDAGEVLQPGDWPFMVLRFIGAPGTGKATIAGLTARYMHAKGILPKSKLTEVSATGLFNSNYGRTAENIRRIAEQADGGVLFLDEFDTFDKPYQGSNVAKEVVDAIVLSLNEHKNSLCLIIAGSEDGVRNVLRYDAGAAQRFYHKNSKIEFKNYSLTTLLEILDSIVLRDKKSIEPAARELLKTVICEAINNEGKQFGNASYIMGELYDRIEMTRVSRDKNDMTYRVRDIELAFPKVGASSIVEKRAEGMLTKEIVHNQSEMCQVETFKRPNKNLFDRMQTPYPREKITAKHCAKLVDPAVLLVKTKIKGAPEMQGTGFLVHPDGYVLTCEHVIRDADRIEVIRRVQRSEDASDYKDKNYICQLIYKDIFCDIALLKFESGENTLPYLPLSAASRVINRGEEYIISGYPYIPGYDSTLTLYSGYISAAHEMQGLTLWYIDGKAQPGNSGSPVISLEDSSVIGILKGGLEEGDTDDNYMIPIKYFWEEILG